VRSIAQAAGKSKKKSIFIVGSKVPPCGGTQKKE
jgi:hypothetical protein